MAENKEYSEGISKASLCRAEAFCARSEHCASEVRHKLVQWGVEIQEVPAVIRHLEEQGFLCEERYIRAFIHDKSAFAHWGRQKILMALRARQVDMTLAERLAAELIDSEESLETLVSLLRAKARGLSFPLSRNDYARLFRFAMQRGFDSQAFSRALSQLKFGQIDDDF